MQPERLDGLRGLSPDQLRDRLQRLRRDLTWWKNMQMRYGSPANLHAQIEETKKRLDECT